MDSGHNLFKIWLHNRPANCRKGDNGYLASRKILLIFQGLIACYKYIEPGRFASREEMTICESGQPDIGSSEGLKLGQVSPQRMGQVFIQQDFQGWGSKSLA